VGAVAWQPGDRVYVDTNLFVYVVEQIKPFASQVQPLFLAADQGEIILITSLLALAETLVMPCRKKDDVLIRTYRDLFSLPSSGLLVVPLSASILEDAARLRATISSLHLPDPIHLATASSAQCDRFVTNDKRLKAATHLTVTVLSE